MADERAAKRKRYSGKTITIRVGADDNKEPLEELSCHKPLLEEDSPFFKAALDKKWREGQRSEIDLPEDDPDTVAAYVIWLYDGHIDPPSSPDTTDLTYPYLAKLYVFGERVQNDKFCNAVMDVIVANYDMPDEKDSHTGPCFVAIKTMYQGTPSDSPGRQVFVEMSCRVQDGYWKAHTLGREPEFAADLVASLQKRFSQSDKQFKALVPRTAEWHKKAKE